MKNIFTLKQQTALGLLGILATSSLLASINTKSVNANSTTDNQVTVELALAVDVSGSVDYQEFELQRQGYINAFKDPEVQAAIKNLPEGLAVNMLFWSDKNTANIGWFKLQNDSNGNITNLSNFVKAMETVVRRGDKDQNGQAYSTSTKGQVVINGVTTKVGNGTDIKLGIDTAKNLLLNNQYQGASLVIDVSGDGVSDDTPYTGAGNINNKCGHQHFCPPLETARNAAVNAGITINGLPINNQESANLANQVDVHYKKLVYGGAGAFVELSDGFDDFARAAKTKILREISREKAAAVNDLFATDESASFNGNVLANDKNPENTSLKVAMVNGQAVNIGNQITLPSGALVTINLDGSLIYNPNGKFESLLEGQQTVDIFKYSIDDGLNGYSTATVSMTVNGLENKSVILYAD
jgi:VCBS repeat-containing protein